jgi:hypothetical protein
MGERQPIPAQQVAEGRAMALQSRLDAAFGQADRLRESRQCQVRLAGAGAQRFDDAAVARVALGV